MDDHKTRCAVCPTVATYGVPEEGPPMYCSQHADHDIMKNIRGLRCMLCPNQPLYGFPDVGKATHCKTHSDLTDVVSKKRVSCSKIPCYGFPGTRPTHCKTHAEPDMEDVTSKRCVQCPKHVVDQGADRPHIVLIM